MRDSVREWLEIYIKGVVMGAADTVPGVSGGTMALITGIYERLVSAIVKLRFPELGDLRNEMEEMDLPFLLVLGLGIGTAVVLLSRLMHSAIVNYPGPTNALFFGLIGASAVVLYSEVSLDNSKRIASGLTGFLLAFFVTGVSGTGGLGHSLPVVFVSGVVASAAMLLPGISGAAFLYILGQYEFMTGILERFVDSVIGIGGGSTLIADATVIAIFLAGMAAGLLSIARAVRLSLDRYREATLTFLVSLMAGSLRLPVEEILVSTEVWNFAVVFSLLLPLLTGAALVMGLDRYTDELDYGP
ncbi:MAG: DUF368 domain-containing protein [Candidatus Nanohaloarchaeota archaeon QJJ-7]|nr:DUF368 domain-containing protein [Candidatus Nanohaloarchaeota archaeon QJJ-7]